MTLPIRTVGAALAATVASTVLILAPTSAATVPTYTLKDSGRHITLARGTAIRISLRTLSDGGFNWKISQGAHSAVFRVVSKTIVSTPGALPGAPTRTIYRLRAIGAGTATFKAVENQPFNKANIIRRFTLQITVPAS